MNFEYCESLKKYLEKGINQDNFKKNYELLKQLEISKLNLDRTEEISEWDFNDFYLKLSKISQSINKSLNISKVQIEENHDDNNLEIDQTIESIFLNKFLRNIFYFT